ncbi:hypothetical protein FTO74_01285 [Granulicella sp. WH15]|uniref:hypothetical protein n=1 Tax=Granulicella sp. WH15 TaxID=2602070 RepID=UPI0013676A36|nr:hypothetical protein [Granulicella sp. WH15]QHN02164.1 hypothetical protein FTO74_01285 [Granulicella sp. WH15]
MKFNLRNLKIAAICAGMFLCVAAASSQVKTPAVTYPTPLSKVDVYGGYGAFLPISSYINNQQFDSIYNPNATVSVTDYFTRRFGLQIEGGYFSASSLRGSYGQCVNGACSDRDQTLYTAEAGPIFRFPHGRFVPFVHVLAGGAKVRGPYLQPLHWGYGLTGGGGVDYILPWFHNMLAVRPIQADVQYEHVDHGVAPVVSQLNYYGTNDITNVKLSGGLVLRFGDMQPPPAVMEDCNASPMSVYPGEPIVVTGAPSNLNPKKKVVYSWTTTGGQITGSDVTANISTVGLAPGTYTISGKVVQGNKPWEQASCSGNFTVKPYDPPTISCSADPSTVLAGTPVAITAAGMSPQNRSLTYSYTSTGGQITGSGAHVSLSTASVPGGPITVTCNVVDDLGKTATATTTVTVTVPAAPAPTTSNLCSVSFTRDRKRPVRVDNEGKACLDDIALTLQRQADAKLVIIGKNSPDEKGIAAAERSANVRLYLTQEKGIDPARIDVRQGAVSDRSVDNVLVPAGATFADAGTTMVDTSAIHQHGQPYGRPGAPVAHRHRKHHQQ